MKVILLTGATDGIGFEAAKKLVAAGHHLLLHGRNHVKLESVKAELSLLAGNVTASKIETYQADLSNLHEVESMAQSILNDHEQIDVLMNNAGVFKSSVGTVDVGKDLKVDQRLVVNTIAPYLLTKRLLPILSPNGGRIVNLSSAAQSPVDIACMTGGYLGASPRPLSQSEAYAQSKLGILQWTSALAADLQEGPQKHVVAVSVNPASLIGTKMVQEGYGIPGKSLSIGADILEAAALSKKFATASGKYFDNDSGDFRPPHPEALSPKNNKAIQEALDSLLDHLGYN